MIGLLCLKFFSNLDFNADNTPVADDNIEGQLKLRSTRFWGRLYISGWPQTIQFFRAHFGLVPPSGKKIFVFAEPRNACSELTNGHLFTADHVVLAHRGVCTYGTKATIVSHTKASAIVIINNEPGNDHLPGPDAHDVQISVNSIPQQEGLLLETYYDSFAGENGGHALSGFVVPINCENSGARCQPVTVEERKSVSASSNMLDGGRVIVTNSDNSSDYFPMEYLLAHFGTKVYNENVTFSLAAAKPAEACSPLDGNFRGKAVLVRRGSCPFVQKAENVMAAGGAIMIVGSAHSYLLRMGVEPRWKGLNTAIPVVMVTKRSYSYLVGEALGETSSRVSFAEDEAVNSGSWAELEKLSGGQEGWPRSSAYISKKYEELTADSRYHSWPNRLLSLKEAYNSALQKSEPAPNVNEKSEL